MINLYIQFINISRQKRITILSLAGGVFVCLLALFFYTAYFTNSLVSYVSKDVLFYTYFSVPKIKQSDKLNQFLKNGLSLVLDSDQLADWPFRYTNREMAVMAKEKNGEIGLAIMIKTNYLEEVKIFLLKNNIDYIVLDKNRILFSRDLSFFDSIKKSSDFKRKVGDKFVRFSSLNFYLDRRLAVACQPNIFLDFLTSDFFDKDGLVYLSGLIKKDRMVLSVGRKGIKEELLVEKWFADYALVAVVNSPADFWRKWKENPATSLYRENIFWSSWLETWKFNELFDLDAPTRVNLLVGSDNGGNSWFFKDHSFYLVLDFKDEVTDVVVKKWQDAIKMALALEFNDTKDKYLSDGTKVKELYARLANFDFMGEGSVKVLVSPDKSLTFWFISSGKRIIISNNRDMLRKEYDFSTVKDNYLAIRPADLSLFIMPELLKSVKNMVITNNILSIE